MAAESARVGTSRDTLLWLLVIVLLPALALGSGYLGAHWALRPVREALAARPRVVVLDMRAALADVPPKEAGAALATRLNVARRLADAGVLVLDGQAVLAYPTTVDGARLGAREEGAAQ